MWAWNVGKIVLVHEVAAGVGEATSLQADMVHGKGEDAESGASRGRYQTATRQDKTDEDSTGDASVAGSVVSVDVPSQRVESREGDLCWLSKSAACIYGRQDPVLSFWASSSTDSFDEISGTSSSAMSQGVLRFSNRAGMGVECRQDVLVHEVAAGVGEATSLRADMVHGKGEDAEPGASRGRYQTATRQDKTDEDSTGDASVAGSVVSVDVARQRVECGEGAVVGSVGSVDVVDVPSQRLECGEGTFLPDNRQFTIAIQLCSFQLLASPDGFGLQGGHKSMIVGLTKIWCSLSSEILSNHKK